MAVILLPDYLVEILLGTRVFGASVVIHTSTANTAIVVSPSQPGGQRGLARRGLLAVGRLLEGRLDIDLGNLTRS